jgi:poly-gamma-glutamate synthesis protein (capsule biosynthesis protein)
MEQRPTASELAGVAPLLQGYDLVTGNIDTVVSLAGAPMPKYANLHAPRELAFDLRSLGLDVATLANNHTMDYGAEALLDSLAAFEEAGVATVGAGANLAAAAAPVYRVVQDRTVAIIACSSTLSELSAATGELPGVAPLKVSQSLLLDTDLILEQPGSVPYVKSWIEPKELDRISAVIEETRSRADLVLVAYHCGVPAYWRSPSHPDVQEYEVQACRAFIDAGADAVLGCHAHEIHGIEFYRNRPIFYCLANFWIGDFHRYPWMEVDSFIAELTFAEGSAEPNVSLVTISLDETGVPRFDAGGRAADLLAQRSEAIAVEQIEPGRYRVYPST